ncbi:minor capsid protein [Rodentibacter pneumotropicus]|uniref:minor capsid protein n=2 Tax=Rodentibacter pneumotropicus TaxID=758 RepID=UPI00109D5A9E|nr:minor capsid protein [Rodentibacter pneumotropicus]THA07288.1 phage head morphogenesis protein [Rodentibacter pneumotropicus]
MKINSVKKPTLDEKIAYALTDRKILHFRYDAHLRREVFKRLNHTQRNLLNRLSSAGVEALQKREFDKLLRELKKEIDQTYQELTAYTDAELSGFLMSETTALQHLYNDVVGFDFFNTVPDYKLNATQRVSLIAGAPLEEWWKKQGNESAFRFENLLRQGLLDGKQTHELVGDVKDLMSTSRRHAETLVITAVAKTADEAHQALRDENLDLIKGEKHLATLDTRTSEVCRVRDGLMWDIDKKPIDHDLPYRRPPLHPRCRSILQLVLKSWKELGFDNVDEVPESTRASMDGQVSENVNYENWLKGKSQAEQDVVLGKGKADLWRRGVITFRDMLDQSGRPLTLKGLYSLINTSNKGHSNVKSAKLLWEKAQKVEPKITADVTEIISSVGGKAEGLEYRLKSLTSLKRKIKTEMSAGFSEQQAVESIRDIVRYTAIFDENTFVEQYQKMQEQLLQRDYSTFVVKNTWQDGSAYKGVNTFVSTFIEKDNTIFEIQYHTQQSFELKNGKLHKLYEEFRDPEIPKQAKAKIFLEMHKLSANLKVPKDINLIKGKK